MNRTLVTFAALLAGLPAAAQLEVKTQQTGPTPAPQQTAAPCPGMGGLEVGQTRVFSFERMARLEPDKHTITRDLKVVHKPSGRPWVITVAYDTEAPDAKVVGLYYLISPPSGIGDALAERYGKGAPMPNDATQTYWNVGSCGVRLRYRARMNEKQRPVEEMWVDPLTPPAPPPKAAQKKKG